MYRHIKTCFVNGNKLIKETTLKSSFLHVRFNTFAYSLNTFSHSSCELKFFMRNLRIRRKNWEYAERTFHFQHCLTNLKFIISKKSDRKSYSCLGRKNCKFYFLDILIKVAFCVYGECAKNIKPVISQTDMKMFLDLLFLF